MELKTIKERSITLLTFKHFVPEEGSDEKSSLTFYLTGLTEEVGKKPNKVVVPCTISKVLVNKIIDATSMFAEGDDRQSGIIAAPAGKLVSLVDKKLPGFGSWLAQQNILDEEIPDTEGLSEEESKEIMAQFAAENTTNRQMATKFLLSAMLSKIIELEKTESQADPFLTAKKKACKLFTFAEINAAKDGALAEGVIKDINEQIAKLNTLKGKVSEMTHKDFVDYAKEKEAANGQKDGYVVLKGASEK